jgi:hypothetical protein
VEAGPRERGCRVLTNGERLRGFPPIKAVADCGKSVTADFFLKGWPGPPTRYFIRLISEISDVNHLVKVAGAALTQAYGYDPAIELILINSQP